jgi:hypothetical protein
MTEDIKQFLDESIQLELNISDLYQLFYIKFTENSQFWWNLSLEEINHAALIRSINDLFLPEKILPTGVIQIQTAEMHQVNGSIRERISFYKTDTPSKYEAFNYAFELENTIGEIHYEIFMNDHPESVVEKIFQKLNGQDKNHALRIDNYMKLNNIIKV